MKIFFDNIVDDTGMSFVVALHMSPDHTSSLDSILGRHNKMKVVVLRDKLQLQPNHIYVTPPGKDAAIQDGVVRLMENTRQYGPRPNIDLLFESFSEHFGDQLAGVILSGTGHDGSTGARAIKSRGGLVFCQTPQSAKYHGMPDSILQLGLADFVLSPQEIGREISNLNSPQSPFPAAGQLTGTQYQKRILEYLLISKGIDFSEFKDSTVLRRIINRMRSQKVTDMGDYLVLLKTDPKEPGRLLRSLLISVTTFFRDPKAFTHLRTQLEKYLESEVDKSSSFRIWIPGCATGEEAFSLAMMMSDLAPPARRIQVFATDVDSQSILRARRGIFSVEAAESIPKEYLDKYLVSTGSQYQVKSNLRDKILFSVHDVLRNPPFINIDLISCRNLLIYMKPSGQRRIMTSFNYALKPGGLLFLGRSESIGEPSDLFSTVDAKYKIHRSLGRKQKYLGSLSYATVSGKPSSNEAESENEVAISALEKMLAEKFAPPSILVTSDNRVEESYGDLNRFSILQPGRTGVYLNNLFDATILGLIKTAMVQADDEKKTYETAPTRVQVGGRECVLRLMVHRLSGSPAQRARYLISFIESTEAWDSGTSPERMTARLESEIQSLREKLQAAIEDLENSNEELQAMNEELQSSNEELQSSYEELETSYEELQYTYEELATVHEQLRYKSNELRVALDDLENIENTIQSAIVLLSSDGAIERLNRSARRLLGLDIEQSVAPELTKFVLDDGRGVDWEQVKRSNDDSPKEWIVHRDNRYYQLYTAHAPKMSDERHSVLLVFTDVSESVIAKQRILKLEKELNALQTAGSAKRKTARRPVK